MTPQAHRKMKGTRGQRRVYVAPRVVSESVFGAISACTLQAGTCDLAKGGVALTPSAK